MNVWIIGHPEAVLGFALVGVRGTVADTAERANQAIDDVLNDPNIGLVLMTEDCVRMVGERMQRLNNRPEPPLFLEIPSPGASHPDRKTFTAIAEHAIGIHA